MKRTLFLVVSIGLFFSRAASQEKIKRTTENGVEVILNHLTPYKIADEPTLLDLKEEQSIDLSEEELIRHGFKDVFSLDVDSAGNILLLNMTQEGNFIFKLDKNGRLITSFGRAGQGPGEMQGPFYFGVDGKDRVIVSDAMVKKCFLFGTNGDLIEETRGPENAYTLYPLDNGNYLAYRRNYTVPTADYFDDIFYLLDSKMKEVKVLDVSRWPNPAKKGKRGVHHMPFFYWRKSGEYLYFGNEDRGYEILQYDLYGSLVRKIRKEFMPVRVELSEKEKRESRDRWARAARGSQIQIEVWVPEYWIPMGSFFADDEGRLFVQTFERGDSPHAFIYDIFNSKGLFIERKSLNILPNQIQEVYAVAKKGRLYCVQEKETGDKVLVVYKMTWK